MACFIPPGFVLTQSSATDPGQHRVSGGWEWKWCSDRCWSAMACFQRYNFESYLQVCISCTDNCTPCFIKLLIQVVPPSNYHSTTTLPGSRIPELEFRGHLRQYPQASPPLPNRSFEQIRSQPVKDIGAFNVSGPLISKFYIRQFETST